MLHRDKARKLNIKYIQVPSVLQYQPVGPGLRCQILNCKSSFNSAIFFTCSVSTNCYSEHTDQVYLFVHYFFNGIVLENLVFWLVAFISEWWTVKFNLVELFFYRTGFDLYTFTSVFKPGFKLWSTSFFIWVHKCNCIYLLILLTLWWFCFAQSCLAWRIHYAAFLTCKKAEN